MCIPTVLYLSYRMVSDISRWNPIDGGEVQWRLYSIQESAKCLEVSVLVGGLNMIESEIYRNEFF